eukprot:Nitzschia sp. Nitz4//scaffold66_size103028//82300//83135//NITZ4_004510-RA/size103028-snap-gene-0.127-mRNA-1//1//CDS//3329556386//7769//frame0
MVKSIYGAPISSKRGLLASLWFLVSIVTAMAFLTALVYAVSSKDGDGNNYYYNGQGDAEDDLDPELAVTSRALAFSALWTAVLSALMSLFGTVVLGFQSPLSGQYYLCCDRSVHKTTPLGLGSFIGALLMLANLTLICSVLFGEFQIRDFREGEDWGAADAEGYNKTEERSSLAFSMLCMFLTVLYAGFAALTYTYATGVMEEHAIDEREEQILSTRDNRVGHFSGYGGYIGERLDIGRPRNGPTGFSSEATLT